MSLNVLIVDDSSIVRSIVKKCLSLISIELGSIHEAENGVQGLEIMSQNTIGIVFTDLNMPVMNGVEMVEKMAEAPATSNIPVVMITTERNEDVTSRLLKAGVVAHIRKPFRPEDLRAAMLTVMTTNIRE